MHPDACFGGGSHPEGLDLWYFRIFETREDKVLSLWENNPVQAGRDHAPSLEGMRGNLCQDGEQNLPWLLPARQLYPSLLCPEGDAQTGAGGCTL